MPPPRVSGLRIPPAAPLTWGNPPLWTGHMGLALSPEVQDLDFEFPLFCSSCTQSWLLSPRLTWAQVAPCPGARSDLRSHTGLAPGLVP